MQTSTKVFVLMWDSAGYGHDNMAGVFSTKELAEKEIQMLINRFGPRYDRTDFIIYEQEIINA